MKGLHCLNIGAACATACLIVAAPAFARSQQELETHAKVTMAQARQIALRARPGKITDQELEKERGGTGIRYSFDVTSNGIVYEVGVDAATGKVLENDREGANPD